MDTDGGKNVNLPKVFICNPIPLPGLERLRQSCDVFLHDSEQEISLDDYKEGVRGMDALLVHPPTPVNAEILDIAGPQVKVVSTMSVGVEHIDLEECRRRGVKVGYTPGVATKAVAEMAVTLTLAAARRLKEAQASTYSGEWGTKWEHCLWMSGQQISGSVIGIVGLGRIGLATARRLQAFEPARIVYNDIKPNPNDSSLSLELVSFEDLLALSDVVIATCSASESSAGIFDADAFRKMKNNAVFVNVCRGSVVNQDALYDALTTNQIAAAGLDVTVPEPLPTNHKLLSLQNCIITPHIASATVATRNVMCDVTVRNIFAGLDGKPLPSPAYE
ncbi:glyoxylate reductase/hydroxypyruvate reductase [Aplysia californica]|uniref:Glyoxylate reductase/hydroxypyruvate reductase n=1 Tax=Aplysia californica TaxID=6500 RepID=A0ABM0K0Q7_APLCA|nr:glyoxylate reductase/hydroxypyruvate reductase [Aplysia californica]